MPPRRRGGRSGVAATAAAAVVAQSDAPPAPQSLQDELLAWVCGTQEDADAFWWQLDCVSDAELAVAMECVALWTVGDEPFVRDTIAFRAPLCTDIPDAIDACHGPCSSFFRRLMPRLIACICAAPWDTDSLQRVGCVLLLAFFVRRMSAPGADGAPAAVLSDGDASLCKDALRMVVDMRHAAHGRECSAFLPSALQLRTTFALGVDFERNAAALARAAALAHPLRNDVILYALPMLLSTDYEGSPQHPDDWALAVHALLVHVVLLSDAVVAAATLLARGACGGDQERCVAAGMALEHAILVEQGIAHTSGAHRDSALVALCAAIGARARACSSCASVLADAAVTVRDCAESIIASADVKAAAAEALLAFGGDAVPELDAFEQHAGTWSEKTCALEWTAAAEAPTQAGDFVELVVALAQSPSLVSGTVRVANAPPETARPIADVLLRRVALAGLAPDATPRDVLPADAVGPSCGAFCVFASCTRPWWGCRPL
jgi:hypothetical protein